MITRDSIGANSTYLKEYRMCSGQFISELIQTHEVTIIRPGQDVIETIRQMLHVQGKMLDLLQPVVHMQTQPAGKMWDDAMPTVAKKAPPCDPNDF